MGCQTKIASTIIDREGDYLLAVKGNQERLQKAVKQALLPLCSTARTKTGKFEKGHGRFDIREYHVLPAGELAEQFPEWANLKSIGVAIGYSLNKSTSYMDAPRLQDVFHKNGF